MEVARDNAHQPGPMVEAVSSNHHRHFCARGRDTVAAASDLAGNLMASCPGKGEYREPTSLLDDGSNRPLSIHFRTSTPATVSNSGSRVKGYVQDLAH
ncbi:hypothetical protein S40288_10894 [Stachybotrys chartarum IBT 40288]|nr:hypothetical protein S40288_10894 [Stachybotrys chartarum IBT 40288]